MAMFTSDGAHRPVRPPESCTTSRRRSVRPSPRLTSHLRGRKKKKTLPHRREAPQLCLACSSDVWQQRRSRERGVPVLGLNYIASTGQVDGAARRVRVSTSPPSSAMTGREVVGVERSAELHPLSEGGAPTFIKLVSLVNIHVKVHSS